MFEGNIHESGFEKAMEGGGLRQLDWGALVARFEAARELRGLLNTNRNARAGNFQNFSKVLGPAQTTPNLNAEPCFVNPDISIDGKDTCAIKGSAANDAVTGDREL